MATTLSTNLSLQSIVQEGISPNDRINLQGADTANAAILEKAISAVQTAAITGVNASIVNTNGCKIVQLQMLSAGCIASITGMFTGVPFTLFFQSVGSIGMADVSPFRLNGALNGTLGLALTLVWDGTNYIELTRSANG